MNFGGLFGGDSSKKLNEIGGSASKWFSSAKQQVTEIAGSLSAQNSPAASPTPMSGDNRFFAGEPPRRSASMGTGVNERNATQNDPSGSGWAMGQKRRYQQESGKDPKPPMDASYNSQRAGGPNQILTSGLKQPPFAPHPQEQLSSPRRRPQDQFSPNQANPGQFRQTAPPQRAPNPNQYQQNAMGQHQYRKPDTPRQPPQQYQQQQAYQTQQMPQNRADQPPSRQSGGSSSGYSSDSGSYGSSNQTTPGNSQSGGTMFGNFGAKLPGADKLQGGFSDMTSKFSKEGFSNMAEKAKSQNLPSSFQDMTSKIPSADKLNKESLYSGFAGMGSKLQKSMGPLGQQLGFQHQAQGGPQQQMNAGYPNQPPQPSQQAPGVHQQQMNAGYANQPSQPNQQAPRSVQQQMTPDQLRQQSGYPNQSPQPSQHGPGVHQQQMNAGHPNQPPQLSQHAPRGPHQQVNPDQLRQQQAGYSNQPPQPNYRPSDMNQTQMMPIPNDPTQNKIPTAGPRMPGQTSMQQNSVPSRSAQSQMATNPLPASQQPPGYEVVNRGNRMVSTHGGTVVTDQKTSGISPAFSQANPGLHTKQSYQAQAKQKFDQANTTPQSKRKMPAQPPTKSDIVFDSAAPQATNKGPIQMDPIDANSRFKQNEQKAKAQNIPPDGYTKYFDAGVKVVSSGADIKSSSINKPVSSGYTKPNVVSRQPMAQVTSMPQAQLASSKIDTRPPPPQPPHMMKMGNPPGGPIGSTTAAGSIPSTSKYEEMLRKLEERMKGFTVGVPEPDSQLSQRLQSHLGTTFPNQSLTSKSSPAKSIASLVNSSGTRMSSRELKKPKETKTRSTNTSVITSQEESTNTLHHKTAHAHTNTQRIHKREAGTAMVVAEKRNLATSTSLHMIDDWTNTQVLTIDRNTETNPVLLHDQNTSPLHFAEPNYPLGPKLPDVPPKVATASPQLKQQAMYPNQPPPQPSQVAPGVLQQQMNVGYANQPQQPNQQVPTKKADVHQPPPPKPKPVIPPPRRANSLAQEPEPPRHPPPLPRKQSVPGKRPAPKQPIEVPQQPPQPVEPVQQTTVPVSQAEAKPPPVTAVSEDMIVFNQPEPTVVSTTQFQEEIPPLEMLQETQPQLDEGSYFQPISTAPLTPVIGAEPKQASPRAQGPETHPSPLRSSGSSGSGDTELQDNLGSVESVYSVDMETDPECGMFMAEFIERVYEGYDVDMIDKARFADYAQQPIGRRWFARILTIKSDEVREVSEMTFLQLVQYFAIMLLECCECEDFNPARQLMQICFLIHVIAEQDGKRMQHYLYSYLREQPIWMSANYWNSALFDAVQKERGRRKSDGKADEAVLVEEILFEQLGAYLCNMRAFELSEQICLDFLNKQAEQAGMSTEQVQALKEGLDKWTN